MPPTTKKYVAPNVNSTKVEIYWAKEKFPFATPLQKGLYKNRVLGCFLHGKIWEWVKWTGVRGESG